MRNIIRYLLLGVCLCLVSETAMAASETSFNLRQGKTPEESFLELLFGSPPPMATERGILLVNAFHDRNGNGLLDEGEPPLEGEVTCRLDGVDYPVPAFIPGLPYESSYRLECRGDDFHPGFSAEEIFIRKRGQIIQVALPCQSGQLQPPVPAS